MLSLSISRQNIHPVSNGGVFAVTNLTIPIDLNHLILIQGGSYFECSALLLMQVQLLFQAKDSQQPQAFFSYKGSSKDTVTGSKLETKKYQDPQEYPMGEWNPSEQVSAGPNRFQCLQGISVSH